MELLNKMGDWVDLKDFEGRYQIKYDGKNAIFRVLERTHEVVDGNRIYNSTYKRKLLKPRIVDGYWNVCLSTMNGKVIHRKVHRLIAINFIQNDNPKKNQINHKNGIKSDNRIENLEWCTHSENMRHAIKTNLKRTGAKATTAKLTEPQIVELFNDRKNGMKYREINEKYGISHGVIRKILVGDTYKKESYGLKLFT